MPFWPSARRRWRRVRTEPPPAGPVPQPGECAPRQQPLPPPPGRTRTRSSRCQRCPRRSARLYLALSAGQWRSVGAIGFRRVDGSQSSGDDCDAGTEARPCPGGRLRRGARSVGGRCRRRRRRRPQRRGDRGRARHHPPLRRHAQGVRRLALGGHARPGASTEDRDGRRDRPASRSGRADSAAVGTVEGQGRQARPRAR